MDTNSMMSLAALVKARNAGKAKPELMVALCRDAIARKEGRIKAFAHVAETPFVQTSGPLAGIAIGVKDILDMLAGGATREEILADYPYLEDEDITAALEFAGGPALCRQRCDCRQREDRQEANDEERGGGWPAAPPRCPAAPPTHSSSAVRH